MILIAECASSHGGNLSLAQDMVKAAADAGADYVKFQTYRKDAINLTDPQKDWLEQAHLDTNAHAVLMHTCQQAGVQFLSTPFDRESLQMLRELGLKTFKIASSESGNTWWCPQAWEQWFVSWPWGVRGTVPQPAYIPVSTGGWEPATAWEPQLHCPVSYTHLTAIPLYPTPLECVGKAPLLDGLSDHTEGIAACQWALAQGVQVLEVHLTIPGARSRPWDKSPQDVRQLRDFADAVTTINTGVGQVFRDRWKRA